MKQGITLCALLLLVACSSVDVQLDYDNSYNFNQLHTFAWKTEGDKENTLVGKRVMSTATQELNQKGYRQVDAQNADFLMSYAYRSQEEIKSKGVSTGIGVGFGTGGVLSGVGVGLGSGRGRGYVPEALRIEVTERSSQNILWRGEAKEKMMESDPKQTNENFTKVVKAILSKFPPNKD